MRSPPSSGWQSYEPRLRPWRRGGALGPGSDRGGRLFRPRGPRQGEARRIRTPRLARARPRHARARGGDLAGCEAHRRGGGRDHAPSARRAAVARAVPGYGRLALSPEAQRAPALLPVEHALRVHRVPRADAYLLGRVPGARDLLPAAALQARSRHLRAPAADLRARAGENAFHRRRAEKPGRRGEARHPDAALRERRAVRARAAQARVTLAIRFARAPEQRRHEEREEDERQDPRDVVEVCRDAAEAQGGRHDGEDEEREGPGEHDPRAASCVPNQLPRANCSIWCGSSSSLPAAARISFQVSSSTGMPSRSRFARYSRSGSPAMRTRSWPGAAREARSQARKLFASFLKAASVPRRAGSITIEIMPLSTRRWVLLSKSVTPPPVRAPPSSSQATASP